MRTVSFKPVGFKPIQPQPSRFAGFHRLFINI